MNYKVYGFITILMHFAGLAIGFVAILPFSTLHAIIYSIQVVVTTLIIVYSFCSKCPCHEKQCSHVILGPITRILPRRKIGKYKAADYWGLGISFFTPAVYQSYWLWKHAVLPYVFYILFVATIALILLNVCPQCKNVNCPFNRHPRNPKYRRPEG
jgi:hypothetical protein